MTVIQTTGGITQSIASPFIIIPPVIFFYFFNIRAGILVIALFPPLMFGIEIGNLWLGELIPDMTSQADADFNRMLVTAALYLFVTLSLLSLFRTIGSMQADLFGEHRQLSNLADQDALTGIANSRKFKRQLQRDCDHIDETGGHLAVYYIDLNDFKPINDRHGHAAGDEMLRQVATRLDDLCKKGDCAARMGGDEFAILLNRSMDEDHVKQLAQLIETTISVPIYFKNALIQISASVGYCLYPDHTCNRAGILRLADKNMYIKKDEYRGERAA